MLSHERRFVPCSFENAPQTTSALVTSCGIPSLHELPFDRTLRSDVRRVQYTERKVQQLITKVTTAIADSGMKKKKKTLIDVILGVLAGMKRLNGVRRDYVYVVLSKISERWVLWPERVQLVNLPEPNLTTLKAEIKACIHAMSICLRSGDSDGALEIFEKGARPMVSSLTSQQDTIRSKLTKVNQETFEQTLIVLYTVAIRAACDGFRMKHADDLYCELIEKYSSGAPNFRTYQTLLRACLHTASIKKARRYMQDYLLQIEARNNQEALSPYAVRYFIGVLCERGCIQEAEDFLSKHNLVMHQCSEIYAYLALSYAMQGNFDKTHAYITRFETSLGNSSFSKSNQCSKLEPGISKLQSDEVDESFYEILKLELGSLLKDALKFAESPQNVSHGIGLTLSERVYARSRLPIDMLENSENQSYRCLEIGPGTGHWVIHHAKNSEDNGLQKKWYVVELRADRGFTVLSQRVFHKISPDYLTIIVGDVRRVLFSVRRCFFREIYINFPEPPTFYDDPTRLYNGQLFRRILRALVNGGLLHFLTDDARLAIDVAEQLIRTRSISKEQGICKYFISDCPKNNWASQTLPPDYGPSSFFDRFWQRGNQLSRYYLRYRVVEDHEQR